MKQVLLVLLFLFLSVGNKAYADQSLTELASLDQQELSRLYKELSKESSDRLVKLGRELMDVRKEYDRALVCMSIVKNRYKPGMKGEELEFVVDAFTALGYLCYYQYNDYAHAYDCLEKGISIMEAGSVENKSLCRAYLTAANMFVASAVNYGSENLMVTALDYFQKCMDTSRRIKFWDMYIKAFTYRTSILFNLNDKNAIKNLVASVDLKEIPSDEKNHDYFVLQYNAMQCICSARYDEARKYLSQQSDKTMESKTPYRYNALSLSNVGRAFELENKLDSAIATYKQVLSIARQYDMMDVLTKNYSNIAEAYLAKGDEASYIQYNKVYAQAKDSLQTIGGLSQVGEKHFLALVKQEADRVQMLHNRNVNYLIAAFFLALLAFVSTLMALLVRRKNKYLDERNRLLYERYNQMLIKERDAASQSGKKYQSSNLSEEDKQRIYAEIERVLQMKEVVCQSSFTIDELSQIISVNPRYVSQVINECYGDNFSSVIAERRVKEACRMFEDYESSSNLTVEGVAKSVGFRSRNSLITAFKRFTGLTPSEYQKAARLENK